VEAGTADCLLVVHSSFAFRSFLRRCATLLIEELVRIFRAL
jgi:hypothetical protein